MRLRVMAGSAALVAAIGGVVGFDWYLMQRTGTPAVAANLDAGVEGSNDPAPPSGASRIRSDMSGLFRRLETMPVEGPRAAPRPAPMTETSARAGTDIAPAPRSKPHPAPAERREAAVQAAPPGPARKGMPTSLLPASAPREIAGDGRAMDPRATAALNSIVNSSAPNPLLRPSLAAGDPVAPGVPSPLAMPASDKDESEMTADELNERELRRARGATGAN